MIDNYGTILEEGIRSTYKNHPDRNMGAQLNGAIKKYISILNNNGMDYEKANMVFCTCFTRMDQDTKKPIRNNFKRDKDSVLNLMDYMYRYCLDELSNSRVEKKDENYISSILRYVNSYIDVTKIYRVNNLVDARSRIYVRPQVLESLTKVLDPVLNYYVDNTLKKTNQTIKITEVTDTGKHLFSNIEDIGNCKLKDNYVGSYKSGNTTIQMASTLGYKTKKKPQQDALLSCSKDGSSMNVIADGAGGSDMGQVASTITIHFLKKWFDRHDFSKLNNVSPDNMALIDEISKQMVASLDRELKQIDAFIKDKYKGSYSTVVVSIVTPGFILFANVGDSTAYVYNENKNTIEEKTVLDSVSRGLSYEAARHNPKNNEITSGMGMMFSNPHYSVMPNKGAYRIIMSSDGVTDLISKQNFDYLITNGYNAADFVQKADQMPDVTSGMKSQDNITAIVIDSDEYNKKRRVR